MKRVTVSHHLPNPPAPAARAQTLGVAVPLANEEDTVQDLVRRTLVHLGPRDRVFFVLDNASKDRTKEKVEEFGRADQRVVVVWAPENRCVVDAYFAGYRAAMDAGCDWILEMDGGLTHEPEQIPEFLAAMATGVDFAAGSRFCPGGRHIGAFSRYLTSKGGSVLANVVLGTKMYDMCSGFECFTRRAMAAVLAKGVRSRMHFFQTEIRYMLRDWNWVEVPIRYTNPGKKLGTAPLKEALRNLWWMYRTQKPGRGAASGARADEPVERHA
jgi:dolichol-phosphate mannosyltransferase